MTKFGQVAVSRIAYRSPGRPNVHPADAALNLPEEKHSHGLRKLAAIESARGSKEEAGAAVARATGVQVGKRQVEDLARRCAAHAEAFYLQRVMGTRAGGMAAGPDLRRQGHRDAPRALRPATARAAAAAGEGSDPAVGRGEDRRKRMAELVCVYDAAGPRNAPEDVIATPAREKAEEGAGSKAEGQGEAAGAAGAGQVAVRIGTDDTPPSDRRRVRRGRGPRPRPHCEPGSS